MKLSVIQLTSLIAVLWSIAVLMWLRPLPRLGVPSNRLALYWRKWQKPEPTPRRKHQTYWYKRKQYQCFRVKSWA